MGLIKNNNNRLPQQRISERLACLSGIVYWSMHCVCCMLNGERLRYNSSLHCALYTIHPLSRSQLKQTQNEINQLQGIMMNKKKKKMI